MRIVALAILMALICAQTADAAVTFGRDKLRGITKMQADPATPGCPGGTTLSNQGGGFLCVVKLTCPAGTTLQEANLCVARPKCPVAWDVVKGGYLLRSAVGTSSAPLLQPAPLSAESVESC